MVITQNMSDSSFAFISSAITSIIIVTFLTIFANGRVSANIQADVANVTNDTVMNGLISSAQLCQQTYSNATLGFLRVLEAVGQIPNENDTSTKCFLRCMLEMSGATELDEGKYNPQQVSVLLTPTDAGRKEDVLLFSAECNESQVKEDMCDGAYHFMKCVFGKILSKYGPPEWSSKLGPFKLRPPAPVQYMNYPEAPPS